jgi:predicted  nucleic acid-binding Zn-ribbon protein
METEIKEIIAKNLPAHVGEVLQQRLIELADLEKSFQDLTAKYDESRKRISELEEKVREYSRHDERNNKLDARENHIEERERNYKIFELTTQLNCEKEKTSIASGLAHSLVRNTEYRKTVFDSKSGPEGRDSYGNTTYATHTVNSTEKSEVV